MPASHISTKKIDEILNQPISLSIFFYAEARAEIVGPTIKYLTPGSTLKLICRVLQSTENPAFIFWYHNNRMINYDVDRGINVSTEAGKFSLRRHAARACTANSSKINQSMQTIDI